MLRKKIARNKSSNFDSTIPISLAILRRLVFALSTHSSEYRNFCLPCSCRRLKRKYNHTGLCYKRSSTKTYEQKKWLQTHYLRFISVFVTTWLCIQYQSSCCNPNMCSTPQSIREPNEILCTSHPFAT